MTTNNDLVICYCKSIASKVSNQGNRSEGVTANITRVWVKKAHLPKLSVNSKFNFILTRFIGEFCCKKLVGSDIGIVSKVEQMKLKTFSPFWSIADR